MLVDLPIEPGIRPFVRCVRGFARCLRIVEDGRGAGLVRAWELVKILGMSSVNNKVTYFQELLTSIFERGSSAVRYKDERSLDLLSAALMSERGEVSGHKIAAALLDRFEQATKEEKVAFFNLLATDYDVQINDLIQAANAYQSEKSQKTYALLRDASAPRRQALLRRLNSVPSATQRLVKMRESLLELIGDHPELGRVDLDFEHAFSSWFNRGFLVMKRVSWQSPASLLEKIIAYEAVHTINDWDDLRRRLQPADRRCFAFFHPAMPDEPLIFVEVALTNKTPDSIHAVLAEAREPIDVAKANTAVFYSISNCQVGLRGVSFGNFLIKQVANDLADSLPQLKSFLTLSPVPGLVRWSRTAATESGYADIDVGIGLIQSIADGSSANVLPAQREQVLAAAATYFLEAKRPNGLPVDPVSRFHLGNGASLENIHWMADTSEKGLKQSAGIMVNYLYDLKKIEENHEAYARDQTVLASRAVRALKLKKEKRGRKTEGEAG